MSRNYEFKARCSDLGACREHCRSSGWQSRWAGLQEDVFFDLSHSKPRIPEPPPEWAGEWPPRGRLKLRKSEGRAPCLIEYQRADSPLGRESSYRLVKLTEESWHNVLRQLTESLGIRGTVRKHREVFERANAIVNLDVVEGLGDFVEVEIDIGDSEGEADAARAADELRIQLGVRRADVVTWSYLDLITMYGAAGRWRAKLTAGDVSGTMYILDGASCSGKTTIATRLLATERLGLTQIPRYCTREPRPSEPSESEYRFVTPEEFATLARSGEFIESRDFRFGMSYGLPWRDTIEAITGGTDALGVMNLGNIRHVASVFPEAVTILVDAPEAAIRRRLESRGLNTEEQINERLGNARTVPDYREYYDHVVENDDGMLDDALAAIRSIVTKP